MKRPDFMEGVAALPENASARASAPRIRNVAWMPAGTEPAMPELEAPPIATQTPVPPPAPMFEAIPPSPPPAPQVIIQKETSPSLGLAIEKLRAQSERLAEQARSDSLELAVLIARRILEREINCDLGAIFSLIRSAIRRAGEEHVTRVRVSPPVQAELAARATSEFSFGKIIVVADPTLERGDVMVDTEHHSIDGRLGTRLDELVKHLEGTKG